MRAIAVRQQVHAFIHAKPFRPFILTLENGQQVPIEHPENLAYMPQLNGGPGDLKFAVVSSRLIMHSTFDAVSSVVVLDEGQDAS